jgi:hypothetical protein
MSLGVDVDDQPIAYEDLPSRQDVDVELPKKRPPEENPGAALDSPEGRLSREGFGAVGATNGDHGCELPEHGGLRGSIGEPDLCSDVADSARSPPLRTPIRRDANVVPACPIVDLRRSEGRGRAPWNRV